MIRFCDKTVLNATLDEYLELSTSQVLEIFLGNNREFEDSAIMLYDKWGEYYGMVTYESVAYSKNPIIEKRFMVADDFWDDAKEYFKDNREYEIPVFSQAGSLICFCYFAQIPSVFENYLTCLENFDELPVSLLDIYDGIELICIYELNEVAWRLYRLFKKYKYNVCVVGEQWEWFGIKTMEGFDMHQTSAKLHLYAEGMALSRPRVEKW